jgi:hypothetical protein
MNRFTFKTSLLSLVSFLFVISSYTLGQAVETITTTGAGTWTAPCGVTSITLELWGAGGGGASVSGNPAMGGGGAGGAYVRVTYPVTPGTTYNFFVGTGGGSGADGQDTWFDANTKLLAVRGIGAGATLAANNSFGAGAIALTAGNIIDPGATLLFSHYGGNGGDGQDLATDVSGGAGASAGSSDNANKNANGITGGIAQTDGFAGVNGRNTTGAGNNGNIAAGGSGARRSGGAPGVRAGGTGGNGQIRITYTGNSYCNFTGITTVEPITNVNFAGIDNSSSGVINGTPALENMKGFCGTGVEQGRKYTFSASGNTDGNFINYFTVYFDWNQDGDFTDAGEEYQIGSINNCASCSVSKDILIPCSAFLGNTQMRVVKNYDAYPNSPCAAQSEWGQVEDYIIEVLASSLTMTYTTSLSSQNNTSGVLRNTTNNEIIGVQIEVSEGCPVLNTSSFTFNTTGTTSTADISNAKLWFTDTSSTFATTTQFGTTVASPNGAFTFNDTRNLISGTNYFWLSYDVLAGATLGNLVDAQCTSVTVDGTPRTPTITSPAGSRAIGQQINWIGHGAGGAAGMSDFNTATNWNPAQVPGPSDVAVMSLTANASPTITFSNANTTVGDLSVNVNRANMVFTLNVAGNNFTVNGNTSYNISGGNNNTRLIVNVGNGGSITYNGDLTMSATSGNTLGIYGAGGTTGIITCNGNVTFSNARAISQAANLPARIIFDGTGSQNFTNNNGVNTILPHVQIGNTNLPNVTILGSTLNTLRPNDLTINGTLILNATNFALNRNAVGGTFTMNAGSLLKLRGTTNGQTGSNFPLNYSSMSLNPTSTVEYDGGSNQTIFAGVTYGNLTLTNNAVKSATDALTIAGNLLINAGSTFNAGTSLTHNLAGNFTNNGTFTYTTANTFNFNGNNALQTISGSSTTGFYNIIVNKGAVYTNILDVTSLITLNNATNPLTLTNGSFRLSSASTITPFSSGAGATIGSTSGLINNGGTINSGNFSWTNNGLFRNSLGTTNIGTNSGNSITNSGTSSFEMLGGAVNIAGRLQNTAGNYTQSDGTINLTTVANASATIGNFQMSATTNVSISGGTIIIRNPNTNATPFNAIHIISGAGAKNITGGTFQIGDASTPASQTFLVNSPVSLFNFTINSSNSPVVRLVTNNLTIGGVLTMNGGNIDGATNSLNVLITNPNSNAIVRTNGFVNHNLRRSINTTAVAYDFPVGFSTNYQPTSYTFTNLTPGDLTVLAVSGDEPNLATADMDPAFNVNAYWTLTASGGLASTNYSGTLNYQAALNDDLAEVPNYILGKYNASWTYPGISGTITSTVASFTGASGFGNFSVGRCRNLPTASTAGNVDVFVGDYHTVSGATATNGTILWTENGAGFFDETWFPVDNDETETPTYYVDEGDFGEAVTLTMTVTGLGGCSSKTATATVVLNVSDEPGLWHYQCGTTTPYIDEYIYIYSVPGATNYRIRIDDGSSNEIREQSSTVFFLRQFAMAEYNKTYDCDVDAFVGGVWVGYGPICQLTSPDIPLTKIQNSQCGITLTQISVPVFAENVWGVELYEFSIFDGSTTQTYQSANRFFKFTDLPSYLYSTTYEITVRTRTNGNWSAFGASCNVTTPNQVCEIIASQCGISLTDNNTDIYCNLIPATTIYEFRLINGMTELTIQKPSRTFKFSQILGIVPGLTYSISVRTFTNGVWSAFGPACNITASSTLASIDATYCGLTLTDNNTDIFCTFVPSTTIYEFKLINGMTELIIQKPSRTFKISQLSGVLPGVTYSVSVRTFTNGVWTAFGSTCNITSASASTKIIAAQCGSVLTNLATDLYADAVIGATQYRFRVANSGGTLTIDKASRTFKLTQLANAKYDEVNVIDVDAFVNGSWIGYGATCNVTTPSIPSTNLMASQCGITLGTTTTYLYADQIFGATQYKFKITNEILEFSDSITRAGRFFRMSEIPGLEINTTYDVEVAFYINGDWEDYGSICEITTPAILALPTLEDEMITQYVDLQDIEKDNEEALLEIGKHTTNDNFDVSAFPNPFDNEFTVKLNGTYSENSNLIISDATGKIIENIKLNNSIENKYSFGSNYSKGIYFVTIIDVENSKMIKIIKQ